MWVYVCLCMYVDGGVSMCVCGWGKCNMFVPVCMYGYAFHRSLRYWAETWHGGRDWPIRFDSIFFKETRPKVKGHLSVKLL